jgi:NSS family neurotransmitter:Na+ symporter
LGTIWKFPYLTGANGGAAFIIIYLLCTLVVGLPVMITEHMIGRAAREDAIATLKKLAPGKSWWLIGASGILAAFLIMAFYTEVAAWVFAYIVKAVQGAVLSTDPAVTEAAFAELITSPVQSLVWQWVVLAFIASIIALGVSKGIERMTKRLMPALFTILVIVCIRSITLPGSWQGLEFLLKPDFSKVTGATVLTAMGLAFFKLSVGMGTMITTEVTSWRTRTSLQQQHGSCFQTLRFRSFVGWPSSPPYLPLVFSLSQVPPCCSSQFRQCLVPCLLARYS